MCMILLDDTVIMIFEGNLRMLTVNGDSPKWPAPYPLEIVDLEGKVLDFTFVVCFFCLFFK